MPKIKIVDVVDKEIKNDDDYAVTVDEVKENESPDKNEPFEAAEEATAIVEKKDEAKTAEISIDTDTAEPTKKIREQQLIQCEKCNKWVTPKTMKYTHHLKCGEVKKSKGGRPKKSQIVINERVQESKPSSPEPVQKVKEVKKPIEPKPQPPKTVVKEVVKTFEELRKERLIIRLKQREERNVSLFKQVF